MKKKFTGILAAMALASLLTIGAGAQGIVGDVIDGAEDVVDGVGDAAEDIVDGGNNDNNDNNGEIGGSGTDGGIVDDTQDPDIPDQIEDDTNDQPNPGDNTGKDENTVIPPPTEDDPNPSTGVPFMTAGLVAISAAGVAYLTKRRNENND